MSEKPAAAQTFAKQPQSFWASVRTLSQALGYSKGDKLTVPSVPAMANAFSELDLSPELLLNKGKTTELGDMLKGYFEYRAEILHDVVKPNLMDAKAAKALFDEMRAEYKPKLPFTMNKQKGEKKAEAYLTSIVNMIIERGTNGYPCVYDPRQLTTVTRNGTPVRTLARRVDGAFPDVVNPIAIWEIKEYYYTTTFGSRVADGVYESLLDGMELEELRDAEGIDVKHYLMVDAYGTWWDQGKPYLCRMVDMLHMGYVDEILFGREVVKELPRIVAEWVALADKAGKKADPEAELA